MHISCYFSKKRKYIHDKETEIIKEYKKEQEYKNIIHNKYWENFNKRTKGKYIKMIQKINIFKEENDDKIPFLNNSDLAKILFSFSSVLV